MILGGRHRPLLGRSIFLNPINHGSTDNTRIPAIRCEELHHPMHSVKGVGIIDHRASSVENCGAPGTSEIEAQAFTQISWPIQRQLKNE
jgi:hypothetical protein